MYVRDNVSFGVIWRFGWRYLLIYLAWSSAVTWAYLEVGGKTLSLPFAPLSLMGIAVAFYVGFKNSQSYERLWEARRLWGTIVNCSRTFTVQALTFPTTANNTKGLVFRHLAFVNALRLHLRRQDGWAEVKAWLPEPEQGELDGWANKPAQLLRKQGEALRGLRDAGSLAEFPHMEMVGTLRELFDAQGGCERLKNTPFPRQYAYFSKVFICQFLVLLPFGLVGTFETTPWLTVPVFTLLAWMFMTMELVGHYSENPFENFINDVPMSALCRTVEIDLKQMLRDPAVPSPLQPVDDVLY